MDKPTSERDVIKDVADHLFNAPELVHLRAKIKELEAENERLKEERMEALKNLNRQNYQMADNMAEHQNDLAKLTKVRKYCEKCHERGYYPHFKSEILDLIK